MNIYWSLLTIIPTVHWKPLALTGQNNLHPILLAIILCVIMLWKIYLPTPPWKHGVKIKMTKNLFRQGNPVFLFLPPRGEKAWRSTPCPRRSIINERHDSNDEICQPVCRTLTCRTWQSYRQYQPCFLWDWLPTWCPRHGFSRRRNSQKSRNFYVKCVTNCQICWMIFVAINKACSLATCYDRFIFQMRFVNYW